MSKRSIIGLVLAATLAAVSLCGCSAAHETPLDSGKELTAVETAQIDADLQGCYAYSQLDAATREKYRILYDAYLAREERAFPESDPTDLGRIRDLVLADHPELFYVESVQLKTSTDSRTGKLLECTVVPTFAYSPEETAALQQRVDAAVAECLATIPDGADDYERAKLVFDWVVSYVEYDHGAVARNAANGNVSTGGSGRSAGQTIVSALVDKQAVCAGYARAYQYILQKQGIQCAYVMGEVANGGHAWCAALLDGAYYYIDPTWGDPLFRDESGQRVGSGFANHDYLCVTSADIQTTHSIDEDLPAPVCTSRADNYYVREGLWLDEADGALVGSIVADAQSQGESSIQFRCGDSAVYAQLLESTIANGGLFDYLGVSYSYSMSPTLCTITVAW